MNNHIDERIQSLQSEYDAGQKLLSELDNRRSALTATLLRLEGALQVLRELREQAPASNGARAPSA